MDKPHSKYAHVYAIVRVDNSDPITSPEDVVTVQKVVWDKSTAENEVERLNRLNAGKGCVYFYQVTRLDKVPTYMGLDLLPDTVGVVEEPV